MSRANILLEDYDLGADWLRGELSRLLRPKMRVAAVALSFRDSRVRSADDWDALYGKGGRFYDSVVGGFGEYGIEPERVEFIDCFRDGAESASRKIERADVLYYLGGLPDRMVERIDAMGIRDALASFGGIVMGYSAGAVIQLGEYHLSPDGDYPSFGYYRGLGYIGGLYHEVHYDGLPEQDDAIARVLAERGLPVLATRLGRGAIIVEDGEIRTVGEVLRFE